jgi:tetratricopeptide (TPR) repeat protein
VPFDREGALKKAEKLLRQGKVDLAIAEYRSVVNDQPSDLNTANTLGDLYIKVGQVNKAVAEYARIADLFAQEGFFPKAVALYRKILKIKPDEEKAIWQLGVISAHQGLLVEARSAFLTLAGRRRTRGDLRGEAEARIKLSELDGADADTRLAGARAHVTLGDVKTAIERLKRLAADLNEHGKHIEVLHVLTEASQLDPADSDLKRLLMQAFATQGDFESARYYATSASELKRLAAELFAQQREDEALNVLAAAAEADPADIALRVRLVKLLVARGDLTGVQAHLTPEVAGSDPQLQWALAEMELREGRIAEALARLQQMLAQDPSRRDALVTLGCAIAEANPDAGFECIEVAARSATSAGEWASAAAVLNEFVNRVPNHIPALMRLIEVCVDGGLEATMHSAQAQLTDAYLVAGAGAEARAIAEDLVAREPWERANMERFRRALTLLGETDIDTIIADRLSGRSPFTSTDFLWPSEPAGTELAPMPIVQKPVEPLPPPAAESKVVAPIPEAPPPTVAAASETRSMSGSPLHVPVKVDEPQKAAKRDAYAIDLKNVLEEAEPAPDRSEPPEVDLSGVLYDLRKDQGKGGAPATPAPSVDNVLQGLREQVKHDASPETAEQHVKLAQTYLEMGMQDEAIKAFEIAARSLRHRFRVGAALAKLYLDRGDQIHAIEWYERAAEAPSPDPESAHALLYDLATALEAQGETARALAVFMELQAEVGEYRDLAVRLEHLSTHLKG